MSQAVDELERLMVAADPLEGEQPPEPGSDRARSMLRTATSSEPDRGQLRRPNPWKRVALATTAALVVVVAGNVVLERVPGGQGAAATVRAALLHQADADTFEATLTVVQDGNGFTADVRVNGDDAEVHASGGPAGADGPWSLVMVGDQVHETSPDGYVVRSRVDGDAVFDPGLRAISRAIIEAIDQSDVIVVGTEDVAGTPATRYDIVLTERSRQVLVDGELAMPADVDRVSVWIAGDLLRQLSMATADGDSTDITFRNIGGVIEISPPSPATDVP